MQALLHIRKCHHSLIRFKVRLSRGDRTNKYFVSHNVWCNCFEVIQAPSSPMWLTMTWQTEINKTPQLLIQCSLYCYCLTNKELNMPRSFMFFISKKDECKKNLPAVLSVNRDILVLSNDLECQSAICNCFEAIQAPSCGPKWINQTRDNKMPQLFCWNNLYFQRSVSTLPTFEKILFETFMCRRIFLKNKKTGLVSQGC